jgi:serine/threonine-protein kinase SRPK3
MNDRELIPQFQKVLGGIPEQWIQDGLESGLLTEKPDG